MTLRLDMLVLLVCLCGGLWQPAHWQGANALLSAGQFRPVPLRLAVRQDAGVFVPFRALTAAGWPMATIDPAHIHVRRHGREVAAEQQADGLRFLATASESPHTTEPTNTQTEKQDQKIRKEQKKK